MTSPQHGYRNIITASFVMLAFTFTLGIMIIGQSVIIPVILAIFIWFIISYLSRQILRIPIVNRIIGRRMSKLISVLIIGFFIFMVGRMLFMTSQDVVTRFSEYRQNINLLMSQIPPEVWAYIPIEDTVATADAQFIFDLLTTTYSDSVSNAARNITTIFIQTLLVVIYLLFLLLEERSFPSKIVRMFPGHENLKLTRQVLESITEKVQQYIAVKTIVSLFVGFGSYVILALFNIEYAGVWATLIFLMNYIPYVGSILAVSFPVMMSLVQYADWSLFFIITILLVFVQAGVAYFIEPLMMGNSLNISGVVVLFSLAVFGSIWGVIGMILAIPIVIILIITLSHFESTRPIAVFLSRNGRVYSARRQARIRQRLRASAKLRKTTQTSPQ